MITDTGHRIAGLGLGDRRAEPLLQALLLFRLIPNGFAQPRPMPPAHRSTRHAHDRHRQMGYDLRRCAPTADRRIPRSSRYRLTDVGLHHAMLLSHLHTRLLLPLAQFSDPDPPAPSALHAAANNYRRALAQLTQDAGLAA